MFLTSGFVRRLVADGFGNLGMYVNIPYSQSVCSA